VPDGAASASIAIYPRPVRWVVAAWRWFYGTAGVRFATQAIGLLGLAGAGQLGAIEPQSPWFGRLFAIGVAFTLLNGLQGLASGRVARSVESQLLDAQSNVRQQAQELVDARANVLQEQGKATEYEARFQAFREMARDEAQELLVAMCAQHGLGPTERLTIYRQTPGGLKMMARHSHNLIRRKVEEDSRVDLLQFSHGLVGQVAQTGLRRTELQGPEPTDQMRYKAWQKDLRLKLRRATDVRMQSRSYDVLAVEDSQGRIVVSLESEQGESDPIVALGDAIVKDEAQAAIVRHVVTVLANLEGDERWKGGVHD